MRRERRLTNAAAPISHYTDAVRVGTLLFISGVPALAPEGRVVARGRVRTDGIRAGDQGRPRNV